VQRFHGDGNETQTRRLRVFGNEAPWLLSNIMVKLTPELLGQAPSALNPIKERQLDLRGEQQSHHTQYAYEQVHRVQNTCH